jgi:hypothetical protein
VWTTAETKSKWHVAQECDRAWTNRENGDLRKRIRDDQWLVQGWDDWCISHGFPHWKQEIDCDGDGIADRTCEDDIPRRGTFSGYIPSSAGLDCVKVGVGGANSSVL